MAKIGTAQIEIKPVLNEDALAEIAYRIELAVREGVEAGLGGSRPLKVDPCPTCSGPQRETVGMVCQTCGTDYGV